MNFLGNYTAAPLKKVENGAEYGNSGETVHVRKVALAARCLEKGYLARLGHANAMAFALSVTRNLYEHLRTIQSKGGTTITESLQEIKSRKKESKIKS